MALLVGDCPRCATKKITFDVIASWHFGTKFSWKDYYEAFVVCRSCRRTTTFYLALKEYDNAGRFPCAKPDVLSRYEGSLNGFFEIRGFVSLRDHNKVPTPDHVPKVISEAFCEGAACLTIECFNAAAVMFRLCLDLATRPLLPEVTEADKPQPTSKQRRDLAPRLEWLFEEGVLPEALRDLAASVRQDANDGAHVGTLTAVDATDLLDFTVVLLERLYTEPERLRLAKARRDARRSS